MRYDIILAGVGGQGVLSLAAIIATGATASEPFINISNYPEIESVYDKLKKYPDIKIVESAALAKKAGSSRATNMVIIGAASGKLPVKTESLKNAIADIFGAKGQKIVDINIKAFDLGAE